MDIGTAKPDPETLSRTPHRLVNIRDPANPYSAGDFFRDVQQEIKNSLANQRIPLLVGGTMLYFNTLRCGLTDLPKYTEHSVYPSLKAELDNMDLAVLYQQLQQHDPLTAKRLHHNDRQRIQRALLVYHLSKKPLSKLHQSMQKSLPYSITWIGVYPEDREKLKKTIAIRFQQMLAQGFVKEVQQLYTREDLSLQLPACRAVGYRQVWDYLAEKIDYNTLQTRSIIATCQLAKRQLTWLRAWRELSVFMANTPCLLKKVKQYVGSQINL
jgi:tRNA dimethylallyltransferase